MAPRRLFALAAALLAACADDPAAPVVKEPSSRITFTIGYPHSDSMRLYTVRPDGEDLQLLVSGRGERYGATWSPDRSRIAFLYTPMGKVSEMELHLIDADGSHDTTILGPGPYGEASWSPDGQTLALVQQFQDGTQRLMLLDPNGQNLRELGTRTDWDYSPAWSPDGRQLAFVSNCLKATCNKFITDLWVINSDGTGARRLTSGLGIDDDAFSPAWSPDGEWIAFDMVRGGVRDIYRIRRNGQDLERLTVGTPTESYVEPTYSPDGLQLLYTKWAGADSVTQLLIAPAAGGPAARIPLTIGQAIQPDWR